MALKRKQDTDVLDAADLEEFIGYNLKRAYVIVQNDFRKALGEDGLAPRVFSALSLVIEHPEVTQSALARMLGIERSGLVAIIDELEGRGFLTRAPVPGDRRVQALSATPLGENAANAMRQSVRDHEDRLLSNFTAQERQSLMALLKKIRTKEGS